MKVTLTSILENRVGAQTNQAHRQNLFAKLANLHNPITYVKPKTQLNFGHQHATEFMTQPKNNLELLLSLHFLLRPHSPVVCRSSPSPASDLHTPSTALLGLLPE